VARIVDAYESAGEASAIVANMSNAAKK
jgi:hypothetical protein